MNAQNCPNCGRIFNKLRRDICPLCAKKEDEEYELVRDYVYDHPKVDVQTLHEETGVAVETIMKFLREDRLVNASDNLVLECESCGTGIKSGRLCDNCRNNLHKGFSSAIETRKPAETPQITNKGSFHFMKDRLYDKGKNK